MHRVITVALLIAITAMAAPAATFYVDPVNGSAAGDGSAGDPWRTFQEVLSHGLIETRGSGGVPKNVGAPVQPGDTILLRSGYHGDINYYWAYNDDYITVEAQEGHTPMLRRLRLNSMAKWIFRGLTITPSAAPTYSRDTHISCEGSCEDILIEDCFLYSQLDSSSWTAQQWNDRACKGFNTHPSSRRITLRNNRMLNVSFGIDAAAEDSVYEYNKITNFSGDGIRVLYHGQLIQYNTIKNCYNVSDNHDDGIQGFLYNRGLGLVRDVTLRGNLIINREDPNQLHQGGLQGIGCFAGPYTNWVVENNVIQVDQWNGIVLYLASGCRIVNNTVFNKRYNDDQSSRYSWIGMTTASGAANIIRNNIAQSYNFTTGPRIIADHNRTIPFGVDENVWFVDAANFDLHLAPGSPAIDYGSRDEAPLIDFDEFYRPAGAAWDAGAFEYGATDDPATADAGPDQTIVDADGDGFELVFLNGGGSTAAGTITTYVWTNQGEYLADGLTGVCGLLVGKHTITLRIITSQGWQDSDDVVITVAAAQSLTPGDANGDGDVDIEDFVILKTHFGAAGATWAQGDFTGEGTVNLEDFVILKTNFGS